MEAMVALADDLDLPVDHYAVDLWRHNVRLHLYWRGRWQRTQECTNGGAAVLHGHVADLPADDDGLSVGNRQSRLQHGHVSVRLYVAHLQTRLLLRQVLRCRHHGHDPA